LLPWRATVAFFLGDLADVAPLLAFFAGVAFLPDLAWDGATCELCAADRSFLAGCSAGAPAPVWAVSAGMPFIVRSPWAVITAIPSITRLRKNCKLIPMGIRGAENRRWRRVLHSTRPDQFRLQPRVLLDAGTVGKTVKIPRNIRGKFVKKRDSSSNVPANFAK
jgi:hypothetical protein